ncbi:Clavaminate synthase-like protein [Hysterangium stoloniferum]|nr:Clavaminate synthase-like protein [Hysterangium stoloniferum]
MSSRYKPDPFPRCVSCTRRWAGDTCRFQGIRFFLKDAEQRVLGISFVDSQTAESPMMDFPDTWNVPLQASDIIRLKYTVAKAILPTLKAEQEHLHLTEVIRRPRETEVRATCDTCMTSIFACAWMCRVCGREACKYCIKQVRELTFPTRALLPSGEKKCHSNPFFLSCTKRQEHAFKDFSPVSRFCGEELGQVVVNMELLIEEGHTSSIIPPLNPDRQWGDLEDNSSIVSGSIMTTTETSSVRTSPNEPTQPLELDPTLGDTVFEHSERLEPPQPLTNVVDITMLRHVMPIQPVQLRYGDPADPAGVPSQHYHVFHRTLSDTQFQEIWRTGVPIVVTDLLDKFSIQWSPDYFIKNFEQQKCLILECNTDQNRSVNVGEFFSQFGLYEGRDKCWKLKDWPPSADFRTTFPDLFEDFLKAVPVPNYTRPDGCLNIVSHFPTNTIAPDIGPKMYNAFASSELPGFKGSTRLHMDMADAVNIMLYSAKRPDGGEGMAAWDIFRADDSPKIRRFFRKYFKNQYTNDPIHSQTFYLDIHSRKVLYDEFGVSSCRLYQRPGEAVFIPAGCAHQVVNLADCIKVACDFVSPENVDRCSALTREFRDQNQLQTWKEDVLQLSAMLWFCWLNLCKVERRLASESQNLSSSTYFALIIHQWPY